MSGSATAGRKASRSWKRARAQVDRCRHPCRVEAKLLVPRILGLFAPKTCCESGLGAGQPPPCRAQPVGASRDMDMPAGSSSPWCCSDRQTKLH